jgi:hypothetical protein
MRYAISYWLTRDRISGSFVLQRRELRERIEQRAAIAAIDALGVVHVEHGIVGGAKLDALMVRR